MAERTDVIEPLSPDLSDAHQQLDWSHLRVGTERALKRIEQIGIAVPPSGRMHLHLGIARQMASGETSKLVKDPQGVARMFEANHELSQLCAIAETLLANTPPRAMIPKLEIFVGGHALPQDNPTCPAQNAGYELALAARFRRAGLRVEWAEPDLVVNFQRRRIAVAAKRISSPNQLEKRLKEAARQIAESKMLGFVAIELTTAANRENHPIIEEKESAAREHVRVFFDELTRHHIDPLRHKIDAPAVLGAWLDLHVHAFSEERGAGTERTTLVLDFNEPYPGCRRLFNDLSAAVDRSMF